MCISEVSMLMFLLLIRKGKCFRNKEIFHLAVPQDLFFFPRSEHFQGENVVYKCHLYFRGKSDCSYSGLIIIRAGQRQQLGVTGLLPLGGRDEETEDYRNQPHWVAGLQCCRKGRIILTLKTRK